MLKRYSGILVVAACATQLMGCSLLHISGPCFGVGCPSRTPGEYSQYNPGANGPKATAPAPQQAQAKKTDPGANPQTQAPAVATAPATNAVSAAPAPVPAPAPAAASSSTSEPAAANTSANANASSGSTSVYGKVQRFFERFTGAGKS
jgi:hypothetical protein